MFAGKLCGFEGIVSVRVGTAGLGRSKARLAVVQLVVSIVAAVAAQSAFAATTFSWTNGSSDGTWENTANWNPTGPTWNSTVNNVAVFNTSAATATLNTSDSAATVFFGAGSAGDVIAAAPGGNLTLGSSGIYAAGLTSGTVAITSPFTLNASGNTWIGPSSSGTLVLAGQSATTAGNFFFLNGNLQIANGGTLSSSTFMELNRTPAVSNIMQTGGLVNSNRASANAIFLSQGIGSGGCNYTISGGSLNVITGSNSVLCITIRRQFRSIGPYGHRQRIRQNAQDRA